MSKKIYTASEMQYAKIQAIDSLYSFLFKNDLNALLHRDIMDKINQYRCMQLIAASIRL